jgi:hypothetical protein
MMSAGWICVAFQFPYDTSGVRLGNGLFQNVLDKGVQGLPLIHGIAYKALVEIGIQAKIEGALEGFFRLLARLFTEFKIIVNGFLESRSQ